MRRILLRFGRQRLVFLSFFFFRSLLNLCSVKNQDAVLKLAVSTLDYSRDGLARVILSKILTAATDVSNKRASDENYK